MATLTTTITEAVTLNGKDQGGTYTTSISGVNDIYKRLVTVPSGADTTIAAFQTAVSTADSAIDLENVNPLVIRNITARVLFNDLSPVRMVGLGTIVVLIKDEDEQI